MPLFLGSRASLASQLGFEDAIFPELAVSGRALALGGAYISKVDDSSAPFYNPAGLGSVRDIKFHLKNDNEKKLILSLKKFLRSEFN